MQTLLNIIQIICFSSITIACVIYVINQRKQITKEASNPLQVYQEVYDAIAMAIKEKRSRLRFDVNHMEHEFLPLYKGFKKFYPGLNAQLRTDMSQQSSQLPNGGEFLEFDIANYKGPVPVLKLIFDEQPPADHIQNTQHESNIIPMFMPRPSGRDMFEQDLFTAPPPLPAPKVVKRKKAVYENNVIDLQQYREKKKVVKLS